MNPRTLLCIVVTSIAISGVTSSPISRRLHNVFQKSERHLKEIGPRGRSEPYWLGAFAGATGAAWFFLDQVAHETKGKYNSHD
jgi:hypothetical protein